MKALIPTLAFLAGCTYGPRNEFRELPFHTFEQRLYVVHASIPHLTFDEWEAIRKSFQQRIGEEYDFRYAIRLEPGLVRVDVVRRKNPENEGLSLFFEKKDGLWLENPTMAHEITFLAEYH